MKKIIAFVFMSVVSTHNFAAYNANMTGELTDVLIYTDGDHIFIKLKNQPATHPSCNSALFAIPDTVPTDRRQALLSRALTAYASKENINIGYDAQGNCAHGYIRVHRIG